MCYLAPLGARDVGCRKVDRSKEGEEQAFGNRVSISSGKGRPQWIMPPELIGAAFSIAMSTRHPQPHSHPCEHNLMVFGQCLWLVSERG